MNKPVLAFDMDGVLVDVTDSYRETIARTVARFTGAKPSRERIQEYKNQGGFNDDWVLSHRMIADAGVERPFEEVKEQFQRLFLEGENGEPGLINRERWVARPGLLERLAERFHLAVFTGRPSAEARITLERFAPGIPFDPVIGMEQVERGKPHPDGLLRILRQHCDCRVFYVGDTVDDARCAKSAAAPFIGVAAPSNPSYLDLVFLFQDEGAYAIVDDINYLEEVFPPGEPPEAGRS
jgi:HAD superfamily phosphatase